MAKPKVLPATGLGPCNVTSDDLTGPASYVTGGVTVGAFAFGLLEIIAILPMDLTSDGLNYIRITSPSPGGTVTSVKVQWFVLSTNAEVANTTNLSAKKIRFVAFGI